MRSTFVNLLSYLDKESSSVRTLLTTLDSFTISDDTIAKNARIMGLGIFTVFLLLNPLMPKSFICLKATAATH